MAVKVRDTFTRGNGALAFPEDPYDLPYVVRPGTAGPPRVEGFRGFAPNAEGTRALLDAGVGAEDSSVGAALGRGGGQALYFREVDANNWWRVYQRLFSYQYQSGTEQYVIRYDQVQTGTETYVSGYTTVYSGNEQYVSGYQNVQTGTETYIAYYQNVIVRYDNVLVGYDYTTTWDIYYRINNQYSNTESATNYYPTPGYPPVTNYPQGDVYVNNVRQTYAPHYEQQPVYENQPVYASRPVYTSQPLYDSRAVYSTVPVYSTRPVYTSQPVYGTRPTYATATGYELRLDVCVAGVVSNVKAQQVVGPFTRLDVAFKKDSIAAWANGNTAQGYTVTDARQQLGRLHGWGFASNTEQGNTDGVDDFTITPEALGGYVPAVLL